MECRPFNIRVLLISAGGICSNLSRNAAASLTLPENSAYKAFIPNIIARMNASQTPHSTPSDEFAKKVVNAALSKNPPKYLTFGHNASLFAFLRWLPRTLVLFLVWRRFSKPVR
jgi:1-acylglycerone phosphate reductase